MNKLSFYLGREVIIRFNNGYISRGLLERYQGREYYLVLRDGSRFYFRDNTVDWIKTE